MGKIAFKEAFLNSIYISTKFTASISIFCINHLPLLKHIMPKIKCTKTNCSILPYFLFLICPWDTNLQPTLFILYLFFLFLPLLQAKLFLDQVLFFKISTYIIILSFLPKNVLCILFKCKYRVLHYTRYIPILKYSKN